MVGGIENEGESMPRTRKSHPPSLKAKVAVEAIKAHKTVAQIAHIFGVHPTQVGGWKKQALAGLPDIFGNGREQMRQQAASCCLACRNFGVEHNLSVLAWAPTAEPRAREGPGISRSGRSARAARPQLTKRARLH